MVLDEYEADARLDGGEWLLLVLSLATAAAGLGLAWRWRPADSIRALRRMQQSREAS